VLPKSKQDAARVDQDTLLVARDWAAADELTDDKGNRPS
jgi:hypothetical protein